MTDTIQTVVYELHPNKTMKQVLDEAIDYRRYCWNQALETWNELYLAHKIYDKILWTKFIPKQNKKTGKITVKHIDVHLNPAPNWKMVRDIMVHDKADWQYQRSAHLLGLAVKDLGNAWQNFFDKAQPDWGKPHFHSRREPRQGFKSDQSKIVDSLLRLERPQKSLVPSEEWRDFKLSEKPLSDKIGVVSYFREKGRYYAAVPFKVATKKALPKTGKNTAVDVNVGHFNYTDSQQNVLPKKLERIYEKIKHYQRQLAHKRVVTGSTQSNNYVKTRTKLQACYRKAFNIQNDLMHKFTTKLVNNYDQIVIENLSVKGMLMSHVASKGVHRSIFGSFKQMLTYKCKWYDRKLILADKLYPSTQRCAVCGTVKRGDERITLYGNKKYGTKHNEFVCYNKKCPNYNLVVDRDTNAMLNLLALIEHPKLNKAL